MARPATIGPVTVRTALPSEFVALTALYGDWGYRAGISPHDFVFVAERDGRPVGIVRRAREFGVTLLRGMYVDPECRGQGIGTAMLEAFERALADGECWCIPFAHLVDFYACAGFAVVDEETAPPFLSERLTKYRREGLSVVVMRRAPAADDRPAR